MLIMVFVDALTREAYSQEMQSQPLSWKTWIILIMEQAVKAEEYNREGGSRLDPGKHTHSKTFTAFVQGQLSSSEVSFHVFFHDPTFSRLIHQIQLCIYTHSLLNTYQRLITSPHNLYRYTTRHASSLQVRLLTERTPTYKQNKYRTLLCSSPHAPLNKTVNMDLVLEIADHYLLDDLYARFLPYPAIPKSLEFLNKTALPGPYAASTTYGLPAGTKVVSSLPRDSIVRQTISLFWIAWIGAALLYFFFSGLSYYFIFDKRLKHHPRYIKNQVWLEIKSSMIAMPTIDVLTLPWFVAEVRGKSLLYSNVADYGWTWLVISTVAYLVFNDLAIYWIHRLEHHKSIYKYIHKVSKQSHCVQTRGVEKRGSDFNSRIPCFDG